MAPDLTTRNKRTLLGAKGIATRSKESTSVARFQQRPDVLKIAAALATHIVAICCHTIIWFHIYIYIYIHTW